MLLTEYDDVLDVSWFGATTDADNSSCWIDAFALDDAWFLADATEAELYTALEPDPYTLALAAETELFADADPLWTAAEIELFADADPLWTAAEAELFADADPLWTAEEAGKTDAADAELYTAIEPEPDTLALALAFYKLIQLIELI